MFKFNPLYLSDGYKVGHKAMLASNTTRLYGTWIPRSTKHAPKGINKVVSFGQTMTWQYLNDAFNELFFIQDIEVAEQFQKDMGVYLGLPYDGEHFKELHKLGYLPIRVQALAEGIETQVNVPHMTFINTVDGFGWLTLYLETIVSALSWKAPTSATIALQYRKNVEEWVNKTDKKSTFLIPFLCHDFSARGLDPYSMVASGLGHALSFRGSDTLSVIPAAREFYGAAKDEVVINSVNASEHSVSTTKIFTVGEKQMILDWCKEFPTGILSIVADTFDLWKLITEYLTDPEVKEAILARDGKLVIRPDSGDPVDITCGRGLSKLERVDYGGKGVQAEHKGVIELLWDIFGGTVNEQGYKVLDSHIGCIYGDSITIDRQVQIYERLEAKGFASTNIVLGIGSFTYQFNTRDTFGYAAKGAWFEVDGKGYDIYKDPVTDDGTKKSLKGFQLVTKHNNEYVVTSEVNEEEAYSDKNELKVIFEDGIMHNVPYIEDIRERINKLI